MKPIRTLLLCLVLGAWGQALAQPEAQPAAQVQVETSTPRPHYWSWTHYSPERDWEHYLQQMTDTGITGLVLQGTPEQVASVIPIAQKYGVTVYAWMWILNNGSIARQHPEWLDFNREGKSLAEHRAYVDYYKFLCPAIPEVRAQIAQQVEAMASVPGLRGISMDYCRYVDQILPTTLWDQYGIVQDKEYAQWDYGYHPAMLRAFVDLYGYNPAQLEDPTRDSVWLQFRLDQVTEVANGVAQIAHRHGLVSSASPFPTPEMSRRMVRQDWDKWDLDVAFPMIYNGFYDGDSTWIAECVRECVRDTRERGTEIYCGLHIPDFNPRRLAADPQAPTLTQALGAALGAGARGVAIFTFDNLLAEHRAELRQELKAFIQSHPFE